MQSWTGAETVLLADWNLPSSLHIVLRWTIPFREPDTPTLSSWPLSPAVAAAAGHAETQAWQLFLPVPAQWSGNPPGPGHQACTAAESRTVNATLLLQPSGCKLTDWQLADCQSSKFLPVAFWPGHMTVPSWSTWLPPGGGRVVSSERLWAWRWSSKPSLETLGLYLFNSVSASHMQIKIFFCCFPSYSKICMT